MQDGVNEAVWIYFVVLIILASFFAVNLALAVLYLQFTQSQAELEVEQEDQAFGNPQATVADTAISDSKAISRPDASEGSWAWARLMCYHVQGSRWFDVVTMCVIAANTIVMASEHYTMAPEHAMVRLSLSS